MSAARHPHDTSRIPTDVQEWILTLARRGWSTAMVARALGVDWYTVARCLDAWGVERNRWGGRA